MTAAAFCLPITGIRGTTRRIALALLLSAGAHLLFAGLPASDPAQSSARLSQSGTLAVRMEPSQPAMGPKPVSESVTTPAVRGSVRKSAIGVTESKIGVAETVPALPQVTDPTYYSARDLDSYPRLIAPLDLGRIANSAMGNATVGYRFQLLIDERGGVNEISAIDGEASQLRDELKAMLATTPFVPGQKDGRPVKSRVTLSVGFDAARGVGSVR
jgi:hypothetical protein